MATPTRITVKLASGENIDVIMRTYVNLAEETGLTKTAIFLGEGGRTDFVAGKRMGLWSEITEIDGRPAIDVAREVSAPYTSPEDVVNRFRGTVLFPATKRLIAHLEEQRKNRQHHVVLYCLPDGTFDIMRLNSNHSIMEPFARATYSCGCWEASAVFGSRLDASDEQGAEEQQDDVPPAPGIRM